MTGFVISVVINSLSTLLGTTELFSCDRDRPISLPGHHDILTRNRPDGTRGGLA